MSEFGKNWNLLFFILYLLLVISQTEGKKIRDGQQHELGAHGFAASDAFHEVSWTSKPL